METPKISDEQFKKLKSLQDSYMTITIELGKNQIEKLNTETKLSNIESNITKLKDDYTKLLKDEQSVIDELYELYGAGRVDLENGTFVPIKDENKTE